MRAIKFRGKDVETGKWVYGDLTQYDNLIWRMGYMPSIVFYYVTDGKIYYSECAVKPETIGQYTGLKDKNGVEIYEGSILQEIYSYKKVLVVYDAPQFCYADSSLGYRFLNHPENFIVVGNIHDNPELLKGE